MERVEGYINGWVIHILGTEREHGLERFTIIIH